MGILKPMDFSQKYLFIIFSKTSLYHKLGFLTHLCNPIRLVYRDKLFSILGAYQVPMQATNTILAMLSWLCIAGIIAAPVVNLIFFTHALSIMLYNVL